MEMNKKERKGKVCLMLSAKNQVTASNVLKPCTQRTNGTTKYAFLIFFKTNIYF